MKLICERDALRAVLSHVASRARGKTKIPILQHVLLDAADAKKLALTATDLDTRCVATCPAEVAGSGTTTVNADHLARLVDGLPAGGQVSMEMKGSDLHITCGRSKYKLPTLPAIDFPEASDLTDPSEFSLKSADAKRLFNEPAPAVSTETSRFYLCGGHLKKRRDGIAVTATNGISLVRLTIPSDIQLERECIIPKPAMAELVKLAATGDVTIRLDGHRIEAVAANVVFSSKLIEATFPDADRVIPALQPTFIQFDRGEFGAALKRLTGLADDNSTIDIRWKAGETTIEVALSGNGSGTESVACECDVEESGEISFSPRVLGEMLEVGNGELVQFHIGSPQAPMLIVDPSDKGLTVVAMPCRSRG